MGQSLHNVNLHGLLATMEVVSLIYELFLGRWMWN